jgi:uncharacterized protein (DUF934 family)
MKHSLANGQVADQLITYQLGFPAHANQNDWKIMRPEEIDPNWIIDDEQADAKIVLPFSLWMKIGRSKSITEKALRGQIGIWFSADEDILKYSDLIHAGKKIWSIIAIDFPIFRDGRGYSTAALLRQRFGWDGELRAIGDILIDQLIYLSRVGFDSFALRDDQDIAIGLKQFDLFTVTNQNSWRAKRSIAELSDDVELVL